jgi:hypothetical protein
MKWVNEAVGFLFWQATVISFLRMTQNCIILNANHAMSGVYICNNVTTTTKQAGPCSVRRALLQGKIIHVPEFSLLHVVQTSSGDKPDTYPNGLRDRGVKLSTCLHLVSKSRKRESIHPFMVDNFTFIFLYHYCKSAQSLRLQLKRMFRVITV